MKNLKMTSSTISLTRARDKLVEAKEPSSERGKEARNASFWDSTKSMTSLIRGSEFP